MSRLFFGDVNALIYPAAIKVDAAAMEVVDQCLSGAQKGGSPVGGSYNKRDYDASIDFSSSAKFSFLSGNLLLAMKGLEMFCDLVTPARELPKNF